MELTVAQIASHYGRSPRFVQQNVRLGSLPALRWVGRSPVIDDLAAAAWARALAPGRRWAVDVCSAALDLLSVGETARLSSSERSRLRSRLRSMPAASIAHAAGGLGGGWARYRVEVPPDLPRVGPSAVDAAALGVVEGTAWVTFVESPDLDALELEHEVSLDPDGNLGVLERAIRDQRPARVFLDTYLLGDVRLSSAAAAELERRAHDL